MADRTRQIEERELLEVVQSAQTRYEHLRREYSQALEEAYAAEGRDGQLLLGRCLQMQSTSEDALDVYIVALKRFSDVVLDRKLPEEPSPYEPQQQSPVRISDEIRSLVNRYRDATAVLASTSKLVVDASHDGTHGAAGRLWAECERGWLTCIGLRDEIAEKQHRRGVN
jgi:hypothetical protein